jgi:hypothetical protein
VKKITVAGADSSAAGASGTGSTAGVSTTLTSSAGAGTAVASVADIIAKKCECELSRKVRGYEERRTSDTNMKRQ